VAFNFFSNCDPRLRHNPVTVLQYILALHVEAMNYPVKPNSTHVYLGDNKGGQFPTAGIGSEAVVSVPRDTMLAMDKRVVAHDLLIEANRVQYQPRFGVNKIAQRYCEHVGIPPDTVWDRHERQELLLRGTNPRRGQPPHTQLLGLSRLVEG